MKNHNSILALLLVPVLLLASCAGLQFTGDQVRPAATIATVAYLEKIDAGDQAATLARLRATAAKLQLAALADNPSQAGAIAALKELDVDPAGKALAVALLNSIKVEQGVDQEAFLRVAMVNAAEGILDAVNAYESKPSK